MKLSRETLADQLQEQLKRQMLSGRLEPGAVMPSERELREVFGVGRTTVREALQGLVSSGFLTREAGRLMVRHPSDISPRMLDLAARASDSSVQQVFDVRRLLEIHAAGLAAANRTADDLVVLAECLGRMDTRDEGQYHSADRSFHCAVVRASQNAVLAELYEAGLGLFFREPAFWRVFVRAPEQRRRVGSGYQGHLQIHDAIVRQDIARAVERMGHHLVQVEQSLLDVMHETVGAAEEPVSPVEAASPAEQGAGPERMKQVADRPLDGPSESFNETAEKTGRNL